MRFLSCIAGISFLFVADLYGINSGKIIDLATGKPVGGAKIELIGSEIVAISNEQGEFRIIPDGDSLSESFITIRGNTIYWDLPTTASADIYSIAGEKLISMLLSLGTGAEFLDLRKDGIFIFRAIVNNKSYTAKFIQLSQKNYTCYVLGNKTIIGNGPPGSEGDSVLISAPGYYEQIYTLKKSFEPYPILKTRYNHEIDYLSQIISQQAFDLLDSEPLSPIYSETRSVKFVYSIASDEIYYTNSSRFNIHYFFVKDILGYPKSHATFNLEQYSHNPNRKYILATLNLFKSSGIFTLDFWAGDELSCQEIENVYKKIASTSFFGNKLRFYANSQKWEKCTSVPLITAAELYKNQNYQALNFSESYGYLKKFTLENLKTEYAGRRDILLLNGVPNDISAVAGIITTEFQTFLSHINVLSHNRGTPNMALRDGWINEQLNRLVGKLVYLRVDPDTFVIREASIAEATTYWSIKEPSTTIKLEHDTIAQGLVDLSLSDFRSVKLIGGKAANFSELLKIRVNGTTPVPVPEGSFAIPFYYYWNHMRLHSLDDTLSKMLNEPSFKTNFNYRKQRLEQLQALIVSMPIDSELLSLVGSKISSLGSFTTYRFRSSTNSEDIKGFNGAGLYDSYTGKTGDIEKSVEKAIKLVWASLWNFGAFEERDYFKIDQHSVAMAVLVHRSFPNEAANGVVITKNLYNSYNPGFVINAQIGEISVTNPVGGYLPDQLIYYQFQNTIEYINKSSVPGMEGKTVLSESEIHKLAEMCMAIHNHYCKLYQECLPVDIEFKFDWVDGERRIYIKQARLF